MRNHDLVLADSGNGGGLALLCLSLSMSRSAERLLCTVNAALDQQWTPASKGPLGVKMRRTQSEQSQSALPHQADLNERCRHFADRPEADTSLSISMSAEVRTNDSGSLARL
jgi:hypothetical protein